tara:strand:+ start:31 stop:195 length:165 start_codon:yes stop_codon:yes gene_type:complete
MYNIIGYYNDLTVIGDAEILDTADSRLEATRLVNEYRMAFGNEWIIKFKRNNDR